MRSSFGGFLYLISWCIVSAFSRVYLSDTLQKIDPFVLCFYVFLITLVFYSLICLLIYRNLREKTLKNKRNIILLNLGTFGCWFFVIYPFKYMDPIIVSSLVLCITPIFTSLLSAYIDKNNWVKPKDRVLLYGFLMVVAYMILLSYMGLSSVKISSFFHLSTSVIFIFISSFCLFVSIVYSKKLFISGFSPIENNFIRFWLLIFFSFMIGLFCHKSFKIDFPSFKVLLYVSFIYAIIPLYLIQSTTRRLEPMTITSIAPLMPIIIFIIERFNPRFHQSIFVMISLFIIIILVTYGFFINSRIENKIVKTNHNV